MTQEPTAHSGAYTCFDGYRRLQTGALKSIALALKAAREADVDGRSTLLVFDNASGRTIDIDTRGAEKDLLKRLAKAFPDAAHAAEPELAEPEPRGRGRPKLGVIAREVTLLPRHWEWLAAQPGGASVALRKLVEEARRAGSEKEERRKAAERAYHFMQTIAGDLPGFEEATRALFAHDAERFRAQIANWPNEVREHAVWLAFEVPLADEQ